MITYCAIEDVASFLRREPEDDTEREQWQVLIELASNMADPIMAYAMFPSDAVPDSVRLTIASAVARTINTLPAAGLRGEHLGQWSATYVLDSGTISFTANESRVLGQWRVSAGTVEILHPRHEWWIDDDTETPNHSLRS